MLTRCELEPSLACASRKLYQQVGSLWILPQRLRLAVEDNGKDLAAREGSCMFEEGNSLETFLELGRFGSKGCFRTHN